MMTKFNVVSWMDEILEQKKDIGGIQIQSGV